MRFLKSAHILFAATLVLAGAAMPQRALGEERVADSRAERPQVSAATAEAVASMRDQVERESVSRNVTVGDLVRRCHGEDELTQALSRGELVGGPRWVDNDTCQVQLEMSGTRVARVIAHIAASSTERPLVSKDDLAQLAVDWQRRTFTGSGSSTAFNRVEKVRPRLSANSPWASVPDATRQKALAAAKEDAIGHVVESIKPIEISGGKTVGDAMEQAEVRKAIVDWLAVRPVIRIEYRLDLQVLITLAGTPNGLFEAVKRAIIERSDIPIPRNEAGWSLVRHDFETRMAVPTGRGSATSAATAPVAVTPARARIVLPPRAPEWAAQKVDVEAVADPANSKLKGAREAETAARHKLAVELSALPLGRDLTVGRAAEQDPHVREAIQAAIDKARTTNTDYTHQKGVTVSMQLDLQDFWDALRAGE